MQEPIDTAGKLSEELKILFAKSEQAAFENQQNPDIQAVKQVRHVKNIGQLKQDYVHVLQKALNFMSAFIFNGNQPKLHPITSFYKYETKFNSNDAVNVLPKLDSLIAKIQENSTDEPKKSLEDKLKPQAIEDLLVGDELYLFQNMIQFRSIWLENIVNVTNEINLRDGFCKIMDLYRVLNDKLHIEPQHTSYHNLGSYYQNLGQAVRVINNFPLRTFLEKLDFETKSMVKGQGGELVNTAWIDNGRAFLSPVGRSIIDAQILISYKENKIHAPMLRPYNINRNLGSSNMVDESTDVELDATLVPVGGGKQAPLRDVLDRVDKFFPKWKDKLSNASLLKKSAFIVFRDQPTLLTAEEMQAFADQAHYECYLLTPKALYIYTLEHKVQLITDEQSLINELNESAQSIKNATTEDVRTYCGIGANDFAANLDHKTVVSLEKRFAPFKVHQTGKEECIFTAQTCLLPQIDKDGVNFCPTVYSYSRNTITLVCSPLGVTFYDNNSSQFQPLAHAGLDGKDVYYSGCTQEGAAAQPEHLQAKNAVAIDLSDLPTVDADAKDNGKILIVTIPVVLPAPPRSMYLPVAAAAFSVAACSVSAFDVRVGGAGFVPSTFESAAINVGSELGPHDYTVRPGIARDATLPIRITLQNYVVVPVHASIGKEAVNDLLDKLALEVDRVSKTGRISSLVVDADARNTRTTAPSRQKSSFFASAVPPQSDSASVPVVASP